MSDRLSPLDVSFLYLEDASTVMHVGSVMVFEPPAGGLDYATLLRHIAARIAFVPRYRQRVRWVPGHLANPVWVDDESFDVGYHVRRSALPRPGTQEQLRELVARIQPRQLDRRRPLWEVYVVEGLQDDRFAIITKTHQALVDGINAVDLGQVVLDDTGSPATPPPDTWRPSPEPSLVELVTAAVMDTVRRPTQVVDTLRSGVADVRVTAGKALEALGGLALAARTATRPAPESPLNVAIGGQRRFAMVATRLEDYRTIRAYHAGGGRRAARATRSARPAPAAVTQITVNDVVLATISGALRAWLMTRGSRIGPKTVIRALVPVSVLVDDADESGHGSAVAAHLVDLPVGEPSAVLRLQQVAYQMTSHVDSGRAVGAATLAGMAGFAPPTLHSLGTRVAGGLSRRLFNLVVTNVPGPQQPLYAAGARMVATYPVIPLAKSQALAIGLTSYDGGVYYGLNADRDAMADVDVLASCVEEALGELKETVR